MLAYSAGAEINQLQWSTTQPDWVAINFGGCTVDTSPPPPPPPPPAGGMDTGAAGQHMLAFWPAVGLAFADSRRRPCAAGNKTQILRV